MTGDTLPLILEGGEARIPHRWCRKCGKSKLLTEFEHKGTGRRRLICKECANARARHDYETNPARKAYLRNWEDENRDKKRSYSQASYERSRQHLRGCLTKIVSTKRRAARRSSIDFDIVADDLVTLFEEQGGNCALTGMTLVWDAKGTQHDTLSIDRIDQSLGYLRGNVRLVTLQANMARGPFSDGTLMTFCVATLTKNGFVVTGSTING